MSLLMILLVTVAVILTIVGLFVKNHEQVYYAPMIHGAALLAWMLSTYGMVRYALLVYTGTYIPTAVGLFGMSMVIIEVVLILVPYLKSRRSAYDQYNERQKQYKSKIAGMTAKKEKMWWQ